MSAYDPEKPGWGNTAEEWWTFYDAREWLAGGFAWTGFDYRGETTPYKWPCISSHFGILDTCGFAKDTAFYYKTWWGAEPVLHLLPHWNWEGKEGQEIEVWAYCNLDSVELLLNGASLGLQAVVKNGHLVWKVKYAPGAIGGAGEQGRARGADGEARDYGASGEDRYRPLTGGVDCGGRSGCCGGERDDCGCAGTDGADGRQLS